MGAGPGHQRWRVKGLEERRNLGSSRDKFEVGDRPCTEGRLNQCSGEDVVWSGDEAWNGLGTKPVLRWGRGQGSRAR